MAYGFNDDKSKNDLSDFALNEDLNDYVPKSELREYVLGLLKEGTHDNIIADDAPITIQAGQTLLMTRNFGTLDGRRAVSFNGVEVLARASNGNEILLANLIPFISSVYTDSDNVCYMKINVRNPTNVSITVDIIRLYYTYIDL